MCNGKCILSLISAISIPLCTLYLYIEAHVSSRIHLTSPYFDRLALMSYSLVSGGRFAILNFLNPSPAISMVTCVISPVLDINGLQSVTFSLNGREFTHAFLVCTLPADASGLLGTDFLEKAGAIIDSLPIKVKCST